MNTLKTRSDLKTPKTANTFNTTSIRRLQLAIIAAAALAGTTANADIVGIGGDATGPWTGPPGNYNLSLGNYENNTQTQVFREAHLVRLPANVTYNAHNPGLYNHPNDLTAVDIPGAGAAIVTSWILHFDPTSGIRSSTGYVDFDKPIYVISRDLHLDTSDPVFGMPGVTYARALADRGYDLGGVDQFTISNPSSGIWRLEFDARAADPLGMDELRVVEMHVAPAPASLALLGLGGLIAARRRR